MFSKYNMWIVKTEPKLEIYDWKGRKKERKRIVWSAADAKIVRIKALGIRLLVIFSSTQRQIKMFERVCQIEVGTMIYGRKEATIM